MWLLDSVKFEGSVKNVISPEIPATTGSAGAELKIFPGVTAIAYAFADNVENTAELNLP